MAVPGGNDGTDNAFLESGTFSGSTPTSGEDLAIHSVALYTSSHDKIYTLSEHLRWILDTRWSEIFGIIKGERSVPDRSRGRYCRFVRDVHVRTAHEFVKCLGIVHCGKGLEHVFFNSPLSTETAAILAEIAALQKTPSVVEKRCPRNLELYCRCQVSE